MKRLLPLACIPAAMLFSATLMTAQTPAPRPGIPGVHSPATAARPHQPNCWDQAGVSKATLQQRKQIQENARAQVQSVCADSALNEQQKKEKIHEIRQQAHQEAEALITPEQQEAFKSCQQSRAAAAPHPGGHGGMPHPGSGAGPCGEMPTSTTSPKEPTPQGEEPQ